MRQFLINKNATLPYIEIEPIYDGRTTYNKLFYAVQSAKVTFSMTNIETGVKKIANAPCSIVQYNLDSCEDKFKIQYKWNKRDTSESGIFLAQFKITFEDDITVDGMVFPKGELIVPISEEIQVVINDSSIKN